MKKYNELIITGSACQRDRGKTVNREDQKSEGWLIQATIPYFSPLENL